MRLEDAVRAVAAALDAGDAIAAAEAMNEALVALDVARAQGDKPSPELAQLVASCQPRVAQLEAQLARQQRDLGDASRASRAYRASSRCRGAGTS